MTGADIDRLVIARNEALLRTTPVRNLKFVQFDLRAPRDIPVQDVVVMSDVVANRPGDEQLLRGALSLVRPGGRLVLHTSTPHPSQRPVPPSEAKDPAQGYSEADLRALLCDAGATEVRFHRSFGRAGRLADQIHFGVRTAGWFVRLAVFPLEMFLGILDVFSPNHDGHGILAVARMR